MMTNSYERWVPFRRADQPLGFRPPEQQQQPPEWWVGPRVGEIAGGGGSMNSTLMRQWWRDFGEPDDPFVVQIVAEDLIVGNDVRRTPTRLEPPKVKTENFSSDHARRMIAALTEAADIVERG
jgi:hypothetical protein